MLESGTVITVQDIQQFLENHRLRLAKGDVVLLYTGWSKLWRERDLRYCMSEPGPGRGNRRMVSGSGDRCVRNRHYGG